MVGDPRPNMASSELWPIKVRVRGHVTTRVQSVGESNWVLNECTPSLFSASAPGVFILQNTVYAVNTTHSDANFFILIEISFK